MSHNFPMKIISILCLFVFCCTRLCLSASSWPEWTSNHGTFPLCEPNDDTFGLWVSSNLTMAENVKLQRHFLFNGPGEALEFSKLWIPAECAYHRFTNKTLLYFTQQMIESAKELFPHGYIHLVVIGDSGTRNALCGMCRIFSGSELYGPAANNICGYNPSAPPSTFNHTREDITAMFNPYFKVSFFYDQYGIHDPKLVPIFQHQILTTLKPYAVLYNSGVRHLLNFYNQKIHNENIPDCENDEQVRISLQLANKETIQTMLQLSTLAAQHKTRLIFRNAHFNGFYGTYCASLALEEKLRVAAVRQGSIWEIWDNRRISQLVWKEQMIMHDPFHYGREQLMWTYEDHQRVMSQWRANPLTYDKGMLELQLAQSLLHTLFQPILKTELAKTKIHR